MDPNGMSCVTLGLEMPQPQEQQQLFPHHPLPSYTSSQDTQPQQSSNPNPYSYPTKPKQQQLSDEDEPGYNVEDGEGSKKKASQWQRMRWTDGMVRLLIMIVFCIGDDCNVDATTAESNGPVKKKPCGVLQKKGKWKSVSRAMMEKGFSVSPQQCEDKFNDLNKRYKRVNDILGRGTACRVVENQSLLDSMNHIPVRMKEEVRKLLSSKHLFFKEMCAYHNSGSGSCSGGQQSTEPAVEQHCFHSPEHGHFGADSKTEGLKNAKRRAREVVHVDEDDDSENDDDNDEDIDVDDDETVASGGCGSHGKNEDEMVSRRKRQRRELFSSPMLQQMSCELESVLHDGIKSPREQQLWMMSRSIQLVEQRVRYQYEAFEQEKQKLKWIKFSAQKERDMERMKLNNERMRLENERMILLIRKKELELIHHHHQQQQSSN